jgi:hypothetical protein
MHASTHPNPRPDLKLESPSSTTTATANRGNLVFLGVKKVETKNVNVEMGKHESNEWWNELFPLKSNDGVHGHEITVPQH